MSKLPYIPDKRLYAAVMGACSYVRDTGWFNKAVNYYADKYGVDSDDVAKYVRMAQSNGQKKAAKEKPTRKYKWFAVEYSMGNERNGGAYFEKAYAEYALKRGISEETVKRSLSREDDYISEYSPCHWFGRVEGFDNEEQAVKRIEEWRSEA